MNVYFQYIVNLRAAGILAFIEKKKIHIIVLSYLLWR